MPQIRGPAGHHTPQNVCHTRAGNDKCSLEFAEAHKAAVGHKVDIWNKVPCVEACDSQAVDDEASMQEQWQLKILTGTGKERPAVIRHTVAFTLRRRREGENYGFQKQQNGTAYLIFII